MPYDLRIQIEPQIVPHGIVQQGGIHVQRAPRGEQRIDLRKTVLCRGFGPVTVGIDGTAKTAVKRVGKCILASNGAIAWIA